MKEKSMTQKQLAEIIRIKPQTLNTWLVDNYDSIPSKYVLPICSALSVTPIQLLQGEVTDYTSTIFEALSWQEMRLVETYRGINKGDAKCS